MRVLLGFRGFAEGKNLRRWSSILPSKLLPLLLFSSPRNHHARFRSWPHKGDASDGRSSSMQLRARPQTPGMPKRQDVAKTESCGDADDVFVIASVAEPM
jgi:hypothetical protein